MMKNQIRVGFILLLAIVASATAAHCDVINGDFSNGLTGWSYGGLVSVTTEEALLNDSDDEGNWYNFLYQGMAAEVGRYRLEFDYYGNLSDNVPENSFPDYFAASLYFVNDYDPDNDFYPGIDVLYLIDWEYNYFDQYNGEVTDSQTKSGWYHYSITLNNLYNYIIPTFELFDYNYVADDSDVAIDNVTLTKVAAPVPEPATILLLGVGLVGLAGVGRRKKKE